MEVPHTLQSSCIVSLVPVCAYSCKLGLWVDLVRLNGFYQGAIFYTEGVQKGKVRVTHKANSRPSKVIVTGARAPVAVHMARLLNGAGVDVFLADSFPVPLSKRSKSCHKFLTLPPPAFQLEAYRDTLISAIKNEGIQAIIPTCEEVFYLAQISPELPVPVIAPELDTLAMVHNKFTFIEHIKQLGLDTPKTQILQSRADVRRVMQQSRQLVFKPVWSRFASDVLLGPKAKTLASISPTRQIPWVAQEYLKGTELSVYAVARQGKLGALSIYRSLYKAGKGAGVCFQPVTNPLVREWVQTFVQSTRWDGQVSFDMMLTAEHKLFALECNPRATSGLHFFQDPKAFSAAFWGGEAIRPNITTVLGSKLAMWAYGLPHAVMSGTVHRFLSTLGRTDDILDWPNDPAPRRAQIATLAAIGRIALRNRTGLQRAATRDIEWNGPD